MRHVLETASLIVFIAAIAGTVYFLSDGDSPVAHAQTDHFHPKGKTPSEHTKKIFEQARDTLPFADERDFEEQKKGFIAAPASKKIMADAGHAAWDLERFEWLQESDDIDSVHPSLLRESKLNMNYGLYEVIPDIYQVRGFDLSNISFVKGRTGWIVFDPLISAETARAAVRVEKFWLRVHEKVWGA